MYMYTYTYTNAYFHLASCSLHCPDTQVLPAERAERRPAKRRGPCCRGRDLSDVFCGES